MPWNEPPPAEAYAQSVLLPALASLGIALFAACAPPAAPLSIGLAWWCWWKCRQDAAIAGFGWTVTALVASHAVALAWLILAAVMIDGARGVTIAVAAALVYLLLCAILARSAAWKYAIGAICLIALTGSLLWNAIYAARNDAQTNSAIDNLRQFGIEHHRQQLRAPQEPQPDGTAD